ncbi:hypothetical protein D4764_14G0002640 [Takifugu flavidus]|uniref:Uncharacterized protein n=1 Tax=Takifugu flavidus TaxID=433684 RepID=A0A5C6P3U7_9TELE|nr:hypothetical protein D4764_14G0002640 [Takifugu flavidus]
MELVPSACGNHRSLLPVPFPHLSVRLPLILPPCPFMANTEYSLQHHPVSAPALPPFSAPASPLQSADKEHSVQMDSSLSHSRCDRRPEHVPSPVVMFASIWYAKKLGRRLVQNSRRAKLLKDKAGWERRSEQGRCCSLWSRRRFQEADGPLYDAQLGGDTFGAPLCCMRGGFQFLKMSLNSAVESRGNLKTRVSIDFLRDWASDLGSLSAGLNLNLSPAKWSSLVTVCKWKQTLAEKLKKRPGSSSDESQTMLMLKRPDGLASSAQGHKRCDTDSIRLGENWGEVEVKKCIIRSK